MHNNTLPSGHRIFLLKVAAITLCVAVLADWLIAQFIFHYSSNIPTPIWLVPTAALLSIAGIMNFPVSPAWERLLKTTYITGLLFMIWAANGLLFDFLTIFGLIGDPVTGLVAKVNWPVTISRSLALAASVVLASRSVTCQGTTGFKPAIWFGYAAFLSALPYPVFRILWAFGATPGITHAGAAGQGLAPVIAAVPWMLAAILSLLLVSPPKWIPRKLLLTAGWSATAIVASISPAACWSLIRLYIKGEDISGDIAIWVFCLFYFSWLLWTIFAFAATRSYQLRSRTGENKMAY